MLHFSEKFLKACCVTALVVVIAFLVLLLMSTLSQPKASLALSQDFSTKDWGGDIVEIYGVTWPNEFHLQ